jgi:hypothetical protein
MAMQKPTGQGFDFASVASAFRLPALDLAATQGKNVAALVQANEIAAEGPQALMRRQAQIAKDVADESAAGCPNWYEGRPTSGLPKAPNSRKHTVEESLANAREISDIVARSA